MISQIVSLAIKKGIVDMSPYVRKAAALAIPKCYDLDPNTEPQLLEYISTLLGDRAVFRRRTCRHCISARVSESSGPD